jgi:hypothetical protein
MDDTIRSLLLYNHSLAMERPTSEAAISRFLRRRPELSTELDGLVSRVHLFANAASRDAACQRHNPGVFRLTPITVEHAEYVWAQLPVTEFAIGPAFLGTEFNRVAHTVIQTQVGAFRSSGRTGPFVIQIDQVEYKIAVDASNRIEISIDNRWACRPEQGLAVVRDWLAAEIAATLRL